jgi:hypothetical protein
MTLTNEQAMITCNVVNIAVAKRRNEVFMTAIDVETAQVSYPDYCHDWSHAGQLLDELADSEGGIAIQYWEYADQSTGEMCPVYSVEKDNAIQQGHTLTEAIARCWLEWWEVTHD